jgi:hypothetical protein
LLPSEGSAEDYYSSAVQLAEAGELDSAAAEIERGLELDENSDLHLLAAIVAKRRGDYDGMRRHVAAIPLDDSLRSEGEWLLRSHQEQQRAKRSGGKQVVASGQDTAQEGTLLPFVGETPRSTAERTQRRRAPAGSLIAIVVVVVLAAIIFGGLVFSEIPEAIRERIAEQFPGPPEEAVPMDGEPIVERSEADFSTGGVLSETVTLTDSDGINGLPVVTIVDTPEPLPAEVVTGSALVTAPVEAATPEALITDAVGSAVAFDIKALLEDEGYEDLAARTLYARWVGTTLVLEGTVATTEERDRLLRLAQTIEGADEVDSIALEVRPPETHVVRPGDNLWFIAARYYGDDPKKVEEIYQLNREKLLSRDSLPVGTELLLPPPE